MTIYDIAKKAGCAPSTVSRVINGNIHVSKETKEKVERIMRENHFLVNSSAKNLVNKRSFTIGIVIPNLSNVYFLDAAEVFVHYFEKLNYTCIISNAGEEKKKQIQALKVLAQGHVDGIVLISSYFENELVVNFLNQYFTGTPILTVAWKLDHPKAIATVVDEEKAAYETTGLLIEKHCKNLIYVKKGNTPSMQRKIVGIMKRCEKETGISVKVWTIENVDFGVADDVAFDALENSIREMIIQNPDIDAIMFNNDLLAAAGGIALNQLGIGAPRVRYFSFCNSRHSFMATPRITAIDMRILDLSKIGCEYLKKAIMGEDCVSRQIELPYIVVERETT